MLNRLSAAVVAALAAVVVLIGGAGAAWAGPPSRPDALGAARADLAGRVVAHTSVGIDPATKQVVVTIADAAKGAEGLESAARRYGAVVRLERVPGSFGTMAGHFRGGNGIVDVNGGGACSLGFNLTNGHAITAGHCTQAIGAWNKEANGLFIGPSVAASFPGDDFGLIRNDGEQRQAPGVQAYSGGIVDIFGAADPFPGQGVCKSGRTTQLTCGRVTRVNVTVGYPQGTVFGLAESNTCVQPGDSGGPWFAGNTGLGLTSGGTLGVPCGSGSFRSFFQPVVEVLNAYGGSIL